MDIDMSRRNRQPRPLTESEKMRLEEFIEAIHYSSRYDSTDSPHHALEARGSPTNTLS